MHERLDASGQFGTYIISESLLAFPTELLFASLVIRGGGYVLERGHAFLLLTVLVVFSLLPLTIAVLSFKNSTGLTGERVKQA
ncbi:MAG: hypothetical protein DMG36_20325 [Acidobacteria bacterium]|nr:MAG: hypothetical protein DMG36_20325 [Acidobacteriota bacterium]